MTFAHALELQDETSATALGSHCRSHVVPRHDPFGATTSCPASVSFADTRLRM